MWCLLNVGGKGWLSRNIESVALQYSGKNAKGLLLLKTLKHFVLYLHGEPKIALKPVYWLTEVNRERANAI